MPLFGALYVGASGLQTSQNALNTTAHNMSNLDTTGYTRQQVLQGTRGYNTISVSLKAVSNQEVGLGVYYSKVRQVRDYFLDQTYRKEIGRYSFYEASAEAISEVEDLLGELHGVSFSAAYDDLWVAVQELAKDPTASVGQGLLVNKAYSFLDRAKAVYDGLVDYQDNLNLQVKQNVDKINAYGKQLKELNDRIRKIQAGGVEEPNDLRDARNQILDELAGLANITYKESINGTVTVKLEGVDFVQEDIVNEIGLEQDESTGFYTPFWTQNAKFTLDASGKKIYDTTGALVYDLEREISSDLNTDIGGLKAILHARGHKRADYTDLEDGDTYNKDIAQSVVMNVQAEFDKMIHAVATKMNKVLADAAEQATAENPDSTYMRDSKGRPLQLFTKIGSDGYTWDATNNKWDYVKEEIYNAAGEVEPKRDTLYNISNIQINPELLQTPTKLDLIKPDGSADYELGTALKNIFTEDGYRLNPNVQTTCTLQTFYNDLVSQVGNTGLVYSSILINQQTTVESTEYARQEVVGVSSDEELNNMIKFQNAYNASSRYINVIDELLEHIINTLGT
ncbi:MAG: flagellar hook-associated protein FlgK [Clostridiales bacterium]|nr:flagellar hook-associated protein FlgK [Clostridiales bacterium]